jgi:transposase
MQIHSLHPKILKLYTLVAPEKSVSEHKKLCIESTRKWEILRKEKVKSTKIQQVLGISRATYYRRKKFIKDGILLSKRPKNFKKTKYGSFFVDAIRKIRIENPTWGKDKIAAKLKENNAQISASSVGRILKNLGFSKSASALREKKKRRFNKHAKRFKFKLYADMKLGENVQIDHMTVTKNGLTVKQFSAWDRKSKFIFANCYGKADSKTASKFLEEFIANVPFNVLSIQVDGGSEFMGEFEATCEKLGIPLFVLPPARPKYNGGVERSNRTYREEFYGDKRMQETSLMGIRRELKKYTEKYNNERPHAGLNWKTPMEYLESVLEDGKPSHML